MTADTNDNQAAADRAPPGHNTLALVIGGCALVLLVLSPWLVDRSGPEPFYKGPLIFPMMVLAMITAAAVPSLVKMIASRPPNIFQLDGKRFPTRGAALFVLMCFYPPAISAVGLEIATFAALFFGLLITGRKPVHAALIAFGLAGISYLAFKAFLDIWFPQPWLFGLFGA